MTWIILCLLVYSAYTDIKVREISNWITLGLIASGLVIHLVWFPVSWSLIFGTSVLSIILFAIGFWSEADVKLAIGLSFWLSKQYLILMCFFYLFIVFIIGLVWMIKNRDLKVNLHYPAGPVFLGSFCLATILLK